MEKCDRQFLVGTKFGGFGSEWTWHAKILYTTHLIRAPTLKTHCGNEYSGLYLCEDREVHTCKFVYTCSLYTRRQFRAISSLWKSSSFSFFGRNPLIRIWNDIVCRELLQRAPKHVYENVISLFLSSQNPESFARLCYSIELQKFTWLRKFTWFSLKNCLVL